MVVVRNNSGIGNRIKNIISAIKRSDFSGEPLKIQTELFNSIQIDLGEADDRIRGESVYTTWSLEYHPEQKVGNLLNVPTPFWVIRGPNSLGVEYGINFQYGNIRDEVRDDFLSSFQRIRMAEEIMYRVESVLNERQIYNCIGVHIRSWSDDNARLSSIYSLSEYTSLLDKELEKAPSSRFFLSSDSANIVRLCLRRYGSRVITLSGDGEAHISHNQTREAFVAGLVDMLLLANCSKLIGSYQSTFTEVAWWLGGATQDVLIPYPQLLRLKGLGSSSSPQ